MGELEISNLADQISKNAHKNSAKQDCPLIGHLKEHLDM